jgi:hypothetical protein
VLSLVAFSLQLVFLGPMWARVRTGSQPLAVVVVVAGAAGAATVWLLDAFLFTAIASAAGFQDGDSERMLLLASWDTARVATSPHAVMIGACAFAGLRFRVFPRWLTFVSIVLCVLSVLAMLPSGPAGGAAMLGALWVLLASVHLARHGWSGGTRT